MRSHHSLRASDSDRDAVVDRLRDAAGEGRLEPDELEQRVDGALRARTYGDLAKLLADLPGAGPPSRSTSSRTNTLARSAVFGAGLLVALMVAVAVVAVVALLLLAAAATWIAIVLFRVVCSGRCAVGLELARRSPQARRRVHT